MLSLDAADMCCWVLRTLIFNVADVEFQCYRHVILGFVWSRTGRRAPDVGCCTQHESQHSHNMVATWEEEGGSPLIFGCCTQPARNIARNGSQHARNIYSLLLNRTTEDWLDPHPTVTEVSDAGAQIGRPGASNALLALHKFFWRVFLTTFF
jgi:hypothetical protein